MSIMQQMDHGYGGLTRRDIVQSLEHESGEVWHYQGATFEIAVMFRFIAERRQWHMAHVGFVGDVEPADVLDINILRGREFLQSHAVTSALAVRPKVVDYQPLGQYHGLCLTHPQLKITILNDTDIRQLWQVELLQPPT